MTSILHSFLFVIYPIVMLLAHNIDEVPFLDAFRSLSVSILTVALVLLILSFVVGNNLKASLLLSGMLILFFSYGHLYTFLQDTELGGIILGRHGIMLPVYGVVLITWIWFILKKVEDPSGITKLFNVIGIVLLVIPLYTMTTHYIQRLQYTRSDEQYNPKMKTVESGMLPDIYYIILDGYARSDVLEEIYEYDNTNMISFLNERGFFVAEKSRSNYNQTALSLASSMNLEYVNYLSETMGVDSKQREELATLIKRSLIRDLLEAEGYEFIAFESGYERTEIRNADYYWSLDNDVIPQVTSLWKLNAFESLLLESTALRVIYDLHIFTTDTFRQIVISPEYQAHRERVLYTFSRLDDVAEMDGNYFVFAHIVSPHPPFVFDAMGGEITPNLTYTLADGDNYLGPQEDYIESYRNQVIFVNNQLQPVIDQILSKSDPAPIIIIQGDHGPGAFLVWDSPNKTDLKERFGILNAFYFPGGDQGWLYPSITPVNNFRIVFNRYFQANYEILEDDSYFSPWMRPYDFTKVTDLIESE